MFDSCNHNVSYEIFQLIPNIHIAWFSPKRFRGEGTRKRSVQNLQVAGKTLVNH